MIDLIGVALANDKNTDVGGRRKRVSKTAHQVLKERNVAATCIQQWWRTTIASHVARQTRPAVTIQAAFRGYRTRKWFSKVLATHHSRARQYKVRTTDKV